MQVQDANGQLPDSLLAPIKNGQLNKAAAAAWNTMNVEARANGLELSPTGSMSSYRTIAQQQYLYAQYLTGSGNLAAKPGTSNHGWGLAVDVATIDMRNMVDRIGEKYGWAKKWSDAPTEWWHIKYNAGVWSGPDPGPDGIMLEPEPVETAPELSMAIAGVSLFLESEDGSVWHQIDNSWESIGKPPS